MLKILLISVSLILTASLSLPAEETPVSAPVQTAATLIDGNVFFTDANGRHALDPLCGMHVTVNDKTPFADYEGKRYYFCNPGCGKAFSANPTEELAKLALPAGITAMSGSKMMANCAVTGERIAVNDKTLHQVYQGRDYFFCCNKCPNAFAKNPDKYAKAIAEAEMKAKPAK